MIGCRWKGSNFIIKKFVFLPVIIGSGLTEDGIREFPKVYYVLSAGDILVRDIKHTDIIRQNNENLYYIRDDCITSG